MPARLRALAGLIAALPLLSGCVAAAIPAVAGGAMLHSRHHKSTKAEKADDPALPPDTQLVRTDLTSLPPPDPARAPDAIALAALESYGAAELTKAAGEPHDSALLADPGSLQPDRQDCGAHPPAVLVDLDPGKAAFAPQTASKADPELAAVLAGLREEGAAIVWLSRADPAARGAILHWLAASGLDPKGTDTLALASGFASKQELRQSLAATLCPIALVGAERSDFDDLYLYLKDPASAVALEAMINHGWFLIDPVEAGAAPATGDPR